MRAIAEKLPERLRSAARSLGFSTPQDAIAILLHRLVRRGGTELFGKKFLILVVVTDPIPEERVVFEDGEGSIASANAN